MTDQTSKFPSIRSRSIIKWLLAAGAVYLLLFTFVWSLLIDQLLFGAFKLVHLKTPEDDMPPFIPYVYQQPAFRAVCDFGHWLADITQPMVSDATLIAHWEKHHKEWEALLDKKPVYPAQPEDYRRFEAYVRSVGLADIGYDRSDRPERFAYMAPPPELGASGRMRPCAGKGGSGKGYEYYPQTPPVIVGNRVIRPSDLRFAQESHSEPWGMLLVASTDRPHYTTYAVRQLSEHWFILRNY